MAEIINAGMDELQLYFRAVVGKGFDRTGLSKKLYSKGAESKMMMQEYVANRVLFRFVETEKMPLKIMKDGEIQELNYVFEMMDYASNHNLPTSVRIVAFQHAAELSLFMAGLFPEYLERGLLSSGTYAHVASALYASVSNCMDHKYSIGAGFYDMLSKHSFGIVAALNDAREDMHLHDDPLDKYTLDKLLYLKDHYQGRES
jgi:hypothetical protein